MFDDITCEAELPDGVTVPRDFQSKDLDCLLDHYRITADGELWLLRYELVPYKGEDRFSLFDRRNERWERVEDFHDDLRFYGGVGGAWHEYVARFTNGKLDNIRAG
jgi:hypothetical protein